MTDDGTGPRRFELCRRPRWLGPAVSRLGQIPAGGAFRSLAGLALGAVVPVAAFPAQPSRPPELRPSLRVGTSFANVFSISTSTAAPGFDELVRRNGGSGDYRVTKAAPGRVLFSATFRYDGAPASAGMVLIRDDGRTTCWNGKCQPGTEASGPLYNPLMWGTAPTALKRGATWRASIDVPWELAPPGEQQITVLDVDARAGTVTLQREGDAEPPQSPTRPKITLQGRDGPAEFEVDRGRTHWRGVATFRRGLVQSDELVAERVDRLTSSATGKIEAHWRSVMLLAGAPFPSLGPVTLAPPSP